MSPPMPLPPPVRAGAAALALAASLLTLGGCAVDRVDGGGEPSAADQEAALATTPSPADVVSHVFGGTATPTAERVLATGRRAAFWHAQTFRLGEAQFHVGLVSSAAPVDAPDPEPTVDLGVVAWQWADGEWQHLVSSTRIGRFGAAGRPPRVDAGREALTLEAGAGRVLLAVPTVGQPAPGVVARAFELFAGDTRRADWRHVGRLPAGSDEGGASSSGTPELVPVGLDAWPMLRLPLQGTVVDASGRVRATTAFDTVEMALSSETGLYRPTRPLPAAAR